MSGVNYSSTLKVNTKGDLASDNKVPLKKLNINDDHLFTKNISR